MLEPSDLAAAVNRLLIGLGQIISAAAVLLLIAAHGQVWSMRCAAISLAATTLTYALQLNIRNRLQVYVIWTVILISWVSGAAAVILLLMGA